MHFGRGGGHFRRNPVAMPVPETLAGVVGSESRTTRPTPGAADHEWRKRQRVSTIAVQTGAPVETLLQQSLDSYTLSDDPARLDLPAMHAYLRGAYWSEQIPLEVLERAVRGSLCIGAYDASGAQVGLARFISDYATFCYICDVYVLEEHRGTPSSTCSAPPRCRSRRWMAGNSETQACRQRATNSATIGCSGLTSRIRIFATL